MAKLRGTIYDSLQSLETHQENVVQLVQQRLKKVPGVNRSMWPKLGLLTFMSDFTETAFQEHEEGK
jgi:hypothetical protein